MSLDEEYYIILHVGGHFVKDLYVRYVDFWVKFKEIDLYVEHEVDNPIIVDEMFLLTTEEGDVEGVEVDGEGDDEGVESDGESDLERVKFVGESDFRVYFGEDNDSEVTADEYASDFATSDRVDNVAAACSGVEEDWNKTEVWDLNEPGSLVGSDEDEEHENGERMRSKFPLYNDKLKFSWGMLFKDD
ncbi:hypothetical protein Godav_013575 [Gossypium davidsonii]|uniref:Uncharacterized protein n=1 Tax=Gossypium davidsonii TaxID=34287 RepID=A0A7J8RH49_GOSDV|nr:hypothetical protein [Gossypium davidsonii]